MARISGDVRERVFNISTWHGVNEAPEGEARLRLGEAAEMRNFCVTSGGALKKRPGSKNVAGLMTGFVPRVREGSRVLLMTDPGLSAGYEMRPRAIAGEMGDVEPAGSPVTVTAEKWEDYTGYYYRNGSGTFRFLDLERTPGTGSEELVGGRGTAGELERIASGAESRTGETSVFSGTEYLETYPEAVCGERVTVRGDAVRREAPEGEEPGWETRDVGGYLVLSGRLWRYYGVMVDAYRPMYRWKKYRCIRDTSRSTYYTEGSWEPYSAYDTDAVSGNTGYSFSSLTGRFTLTGSSVRRTEGSGTVYSGGGSSVIRSVYSPGTGRAALSVVQTRKSAAGPYTRTSVSYSVGESLGTVDAAEGENPDAGAGIAYVTAFYSGGVQYTVMMKDGEYFCYARDEGAGVVSSRREYGFYGYPIDVSPDRVRWYFAETYSTPNEGADTQVRGIWSGYVGGREVLCAACGGYLWELREENGVWSKTPAGDMDTSRDVHMFGFDEKLYILNGAKYLVWDGERLAEVEGYRPLISVAAVPEGGGTLLENVNRLTAGRRCWFSPDGEATVFHLPETQVASVDWVKRLDGDGAAPDFVFDLEAGTVTFMEAPERGVNTLEIAWSGKESLRGQVEAMRFAETYNGAQDTRVFIYGDGSNRAFYSGLDHDGKPRADYFPDLYEAAVGDANTPITAMIRHYDKLLAFKEDSAWSIGYDTITLVDGTVTAGFYVAPVNRAIGNCAYGQARLVQNRPRTLDGRSVIEWKATGYNGITGDQRNAERVSQRVDSSIRQFDLTKARTFYDKFSHEYYVIGEDGTAIAQNLDVDAWYVYTGLDVTCMINYRDELYFGTRDGYLRHFSDRYFSDNGEAIDAYWESGAMSFSEDFRRKYSAMIWVGIKPEDNGYLEVTAQTDRKSDFAVYEMGTASAAGVPEMERIKLKAKKFTYYKLILRNNTGDRTATVVSADIRVRGTGYVR